MEYFNVGEIYVSGINRLSSNKESNSSLRDNWCQVLKITAISGDIIYFYVIGTYPKVSVVSHMSSFRDTPANREFFKKTNDPKLLAVAKDIILTVFNKE